MALIGVLDNKSGGQQCFRAVAAVDLPSVATLASITVSVTITGLEIGDIVLVVPIAAVTTGLLVETTPALVAAANAVVVRATNASAGTIDQTTQNMTFLVFRNNVPL